MCSEVMMNWPLKVKIEKSGGLARKLAPDIASLLFLASAGERG